LQRSRSVPVKMSKESRTNYSSGDHPQDESNIEDNEAKLHDVISRLRDLVSGEADITLLASYVGTRVFVLNKKVYFCIHNLLITFSGF
jgi:hypothetical protein